MTLFTTGYIAAGLAYTLAVSWKARKEPEMIASLDRECKVVGILVCILLWPIFFLAGVIYKIIE
jgi:hypothetical protein